MNKRDIWFDIMRRADRFSRDLLAESAEVPMSFMVFSDDHDSLRHFVVGEMGGEQHRAEVFGLIGMIATSGQAHGVCVMGEANVEILERTDGEDDKAFRERAMSRKREGRLSRVLATVVIYRDEDDERRMISSYTDIKRGPDGRVERLGVPTIAEESQVVAFGSILNLIPKRVQPAEEAVAAAAWLVKHAAKEMRRLGVFMINAEKASGMKPMNS